MKRRPFRNFTLITTLGASACAPANLGQSPEILWWTDHETGNFSDWDTGGYHWSALGGSVEIATSPSPARPLFAALDVTSPGSGSQSSAGASRNGGLPTEAYTSTYVEWNVGGEAEVIAPAPATMYVDDAAVSTQRLGPDFPVFWRGQ